MCGICGILYFDQQRNVSREDLWTMNEVQKHRGPDDEGYFTSGPIGLAHRRLSIIDLESGHQPMANEDQTMWIVFNGEIYNFHELKRKLLSKGHTFKTKSDTEVIIHLYEDYAERCLDHLRGMFAFAIWDTRRRRLFLARDRMGQKPLFYYQDTEKFAFASELKGIKMLQGIKLSHDYAALNNYFKYGYIPAPQTVYAEAKKLPPACHMTICDSRIHIKRYWHVPLPEPSYKEEDVEERLEAMLDESVKIRLISDVPLGGFLSGGLDSSLIVALMQKNSPRPVNTFSIGFEDQSYDERPYARVVSSFLKTDHKEFVIKDDIQDSLMHIVRHFDEPFADSSAMPTYYLSRMTREHVTVALSGDGGDELFAGYKRYVARKISRYYLSLPVTIREKLVRQLLNLLPVSTKYYGQSLLKQLRLFTDFSKKIGTDCLEVAPVLFTDVERKKLLPPHIIEGIAPDDPVNQWSRAFSDLDELSHMMWTDCLTYLPDDILTKVDRMSMAAGLEVRSPFLDHMLVEFLAKIPITMKIKGFKTKYVLKQIARKYIPKQIVERNKHGFMVPLALWFKTNLKELMHELLSPNGDLLEQKFISRLLEEHAQGKQDHAQKIWSILVFRLWEETHG